MKRVGTMLSDRGDRAKASSGPTSDGDIARVEDAHKELIADSAFASRYVSVPVPKKLLPENAMPSNVAYQLIRDLRNLDANPRLNLASFVTTWMEPEADKLIKESANVNFVDMEEYPSSTEIHNRCVSMIANLFHCPDPDVPIGTGTIGSSEAIILAGLAMKAKWKARRRAEGKSTENPNLIMGYNVQVCWEKFCRYAEVEEKFGVLSETCFTLTPEHVHSLIDEDTIGVVGILGSTYTGEYEDIAALDAAVEEVNQRTGWCVPVHVDAASGGFVAPFVNPDLKWDFRLKNVGSINVSGHKYGLVYPGVGWAFWRSREYLPESLVFHTNYLGSDQPSFTLNFSKGASMIIAQYYQFLRLGREGYTKIMKNLMNVAAYLQKSIEETDHFEILSNTTSLPLVAFKLTKLIGADGKMHSRVYDEFDVSDRLRHSGWVIPAYTMAPNARHVKLLRAVVREDLSYSMVEALVDDIKRAIVWLDSHFIFTLDQMNNIKANLHVERLDSNVWRAVKHNAGVC